MTGDPIVTDTNKNKKLDAQDLLEKLNTEDLSRGRHILHAIMGDALVDPKNDFKLMGGGEVDITIPSSKELEGRLKKFFDKMAHLTDEQINQVGQEMKKREHSTPEEVQTLINLEKDIRSFAQNLSTSFPQGIHIDTDSEAENIYAHALTTFMNAVNKPEDKAQPQPQKQQKPQKAQKSSGVNYV